MLKLLICMFFGMAAAVVLLELREQRLNLTYQTDGLHNRIEATQAELWNQQLSIAVDTAPEAVAAAAKLQNLNLHAPTTRPGVRPWIIDPDAPE